MATRAGVRRRGLTLIEVMVVIAIVALMIGLLLPAVQQARDMGRRSACGNTLRQVALAMVSYEQAKGYFPFLWGVSNTGSPTPCVVNVTSGPCTRSSNPQGNEGNNGGWMYMLPMLEEPRLYDQIAKPMTVGSWSALAFGPIRESTWYPPYQAVIPAFQCPASPPGLRNTWNNYPGRRNFFMCSGDSIYQGISINAVRGTRGMFGFTNTPLGKGYRVNQVTDGTSKTILLGEKGNPQSLTDIRGMGATNVTNLNTNPGGCLSRATGFNYNAGVSVQTSRIHTEMWHMGMGPFGAFNTVLPPNAPTCMADNWGDGWGLFTASSFHQNGVNVAMADSSIRWINDTIDTGDLTKAEVTSGPSPYGVWGALGTRDGEGNGREAIDGG